MIDRAVVGRVASRMSRHARSLVSSAGKATGRDRRGSHSRFEFEALEPRVLLSGDHPGIDEVFPDTGPGVQPTEIVFTDPNEAFAFAAGIIEDVPNDTGDFFRFTAVNSGFTSVLAIDLPSSGTTPLDTAVEVFLPDGTELTGENDGLNNGTLARAGLVSDGQFGFIATAGQEYFVRVIGENRDAIAPASADGLYSITINNEITQLTLDADGIARTGSDSGDAEVLDGAQDDLIYSFTTPNDESFNGLGYVLTGDIVFGNTADGYIDPGDIGAERDIVDTQVEVYDSAGNLIASDSDSGYIWDAFALVRFQADETYYVRVRSDAIVQTDVVNPQDPDPFPNNVNDVNAGQFELRIQARATDVAIDADTRVGIVDRSSSGTEVDDGLTAVAVDPAGLLRDQHSAQIFTFDSLGEGTAFINFFTFGDPMAMTPFEEIVDTKLSVFDDSDSLIAIADNDTLFTGDTYDRPGLTLQVTTDDTYYVVVDAFDGRFLGVGVPPEDVGEGQFDYRLAIETPTNLDRGNGDQPVDDHIDLLREDNSDATTAILGDVVSALATPLVWGAPIQPVGFVDVNDNGDDDQNMNDIPDEYDSNSATRFENQILLDHSPVVQAFASGRLDSFADTDVFQFVPQVDMLGTYEGGIDLEFDGGAGLGAAPGQQWLVGGRPASRLTVNVFFETEWLEAGGTAVQIYDSNFELVDEAQAIPITNVNAGVGASAELDSPSGVESPSLLGPDAGGGSNIDRAKTAASISLDAQYWAGEAYYIVISAPEGPSRYSMVVQADANTQIADTSMGFVVDDEVADEGNFGAAPELVFDTVSGIATNNGNLQATEDTRFFGAVDSDRFTFDEDTMMRDLDNDYFNQIFNSSGLGLIHERGDEDLYRITAPATGTVEIVVGTRGLNDTFNEAFLLDNIFVEGTANAKTYNSPLDAAIRVFDSTGTEIAFVDNFTGFGSGQTIPFGQSGNFNAQDIEVTRKDPRVVINVEEGQQYFIQVESSQKDVADRDVDWLVATGSYQLFVNATPNQPGADDHADFFGLFQSTVVPANVEPSFGENNIGLVNGRIETLDDSDAFEYVAPRAGTISFQLDPVAGLSLSLFILNGDNEIVPLLNSTALDGELLVGSFVANQGERFSLLVGGIGGTGDYTLRLVGQAFGDDVSDTGSFASAGAEQITFGPFDRTVSASGTIEDAADSDLFTFTAPVSDPITLTLSNAESSPSFAGSVIVYEISSDPTLTSSPDQNNEVRRAVAYELNQGQSGTITLRFSAQANREYHVLVAGADPSLTTGSYTLGLTYTPDDDHGDIGDPLGATFVNIVPETGLGSVTGILEQVNDTDGFIFGTAAAGPVDISLVWDPEPGAFFELRLFDLDNNLLDPDGVAPQDTFSSSSGFLAIDSFNALPGEFFYVVVLGPTAVDINYTLNVNTGLLDDHANEGDTSNATLIERDLFTGDGTANGRLEIDDDTDLFTFEVFEGETVDLTLSGTSLATPVIRVFDSTGTLFTTTPITDGVSFTNTGMPEQFFISIGSTFPGIRSGVYTLNVNGEPLPPPPSDDHANAGDFANATVLSVSPVTGDARQAGIIDGEDGLPVVDTDLFSYTSSAAGEVFVQVVSSGDPLPDFRLRVFDAAGNELTDLADDAGVPGTPSVTASTAFRTTAAGETFFFLVDSPNQLDRGDYTINVDGTALTSVVFYPEGFANANIREFVSLANNNDVAVDYTIRVFYADSSLSSAIVASGTLAADARGGATLSFGEDIDGDGAADFAPGIVPNEAYAIVVESALPLAAGLSHYDSGLVGRTDGRGPGAIGESFTDQLSNEWLFADIERNPGVVAQFLIYFNPNPFDVDVTITAFTSTGQVELPTFTLEANRRGGLEVHNTPALPIGTFAVSITSEASNPANEPLNLGIVAAASQYNLINETAYGLLGVPDGGSNTSIITSLTSGGGASAEIDLFNPDPNGDVTVTIFGSYLTDQNLQDLERNIILGAGQRTTLTGFDLAFIPGTPIGLRITTDQGGVTGSPIAVSSVETQRGDTTGTSASFQAGTSFFYGDAFINPTEAGNLYSESLSFYNPSDTDTNVIVTFFFADGSQQRTLSRVVEGQDFLRLQLEDLPEVVGARPQLNFFSIRVESDSAIISQLSHFDGVLGGGWAAVGAPLGLVNPIS
ncbi:MAG: LEPR-XLL domain-containing protein [Planctomycetota bacterium]